MVSGFNFQGSRASKSILKFEGYHFYFNPAPFLRHFWAAHINDRKRNHRFEGRIRCRGLHTQSSTAGGYNFSSFEGTSEAIEPEIQLQWPEFGPHPDSINHKQFDRNWSSEAYQVLKNKNLALKISKPKTLDPSNESLSDQYSSSKVIRTPGHIQKWDRKRRKNFRRPTKKLQSEHDEFLYGWSLPFNLLNKWSKANNVNRRETFGFARRVPTGKAPAINKGKAQAPHDWTKFTFDRYVYELASVRPIAHLVSRAGHPGMGKERESRSTQQIGKTLYSLMHQRDLQKFLEPQVCHVALHYLIRYGLVAEARALLLRMEDLSMDISVSTFNLFLRAAVHRRDQYLFTWFLQIMIRRDLSPNSETWALFLQCLSSSTQKRMVIKNMFVFRMLKKPLVRTAVLSATIRDKIANFREVKKRLLLKPVAFLRQLRRDHGNGWANSRIGNIIVDSFCKDLSLNEGVQLIQPLKRHGFRPNTITLNTPLFQAIEIRCLPLIADVLDLFATEHNLVPDCHGYQKLFQYAWHRCYLNVSLVVWIAACINGAITKDMQEKVLSCIRLNNDMQTLQRMGLDNLHVDHRIGGRSVPRPHEAARLPGLTTRVYKSLMGNFVLGLNPFQHQGPLQAQSVMNKMVQNLATARLKLKYSLGFNLRQAHKLDTEWRIHEGENVQEKVQSYCPVLLDHAPGGPNRDEGKPPLNPSVSYTWYIS